MLDLESLANAVTVGTAVWAVIGGVAGGIGTSVI